ncbi:hypothetical protein BTVI_53537 [Pitangus sulphuratus]|nr:hypothetical protein BTVI_53537 [Pitangus sulphuratus]
MRIKKASRMKYSIIFPVIEDLAFGLVELHEVFMDSALMTLKVSLDGISSIQCVDYNTQLGVIGMFAEDALDSSAHVTNKDVK